MTPFSLLHFKISTFQLGGGYRRPQHTNVPTSSYLAVHADCTVLHHRLRYLITSWTQAVLPLPTTHFSLVNLKRRIEYKFLSGLPNTTVSYILDSRVYDAHVRIGLPPAGADNIWISALLFHQFEHGFFSFSRRLSYLVFFRSLLSFLSHGLPEALAVASCSHASLFSTRHECHLVLFSLVVFTSFYI